jgi:hypothetical protein
MAYVINESLLSPINAQLARHRADYIRNYGLDPGDKLGLTDKALAPLAAIQDVTTDRGPAQGKSVYPNVSAAFVSSSLDYDFHICPVCFDCPTDPHGHFLCAHIVCKSCFDACRKETGVYRCPVCRTETQGQYRGSIADKSPLLLQLFDNIDYTCPHTECAFTGNLIKYRKHITVDCPQRVVKCANEGCNFQGIFKSLKEEHWSICKKFMFRCRRCKKSVVAGSAAFHHLECEPLKSM